MVSSKQTSRRDALANLALAVTLIPGLGIAANHVLRFLIPEKDRRTEELLLAKVSELQIGGSRVFRGVLGNDLLAVRLAEGGVKVFSSICTHLGCQVQWDPTEGNFLCPCHMGRFDTNGDVIAGPPPKPMPSYPVRVDGDNVFVTVPVKEG